ncbi:hypothetical protein AGMMS49574_03820 [Bacteroidia bacterium]|nr:hypothetical protein AGMMS49574_03820 [Bacteroidia bacterium]
MRKNQMRTKGTIIMIGILVFFITANGQKMETSFGVKAGINFATLANTQTEGVAFSPGLKTDAIVGVVCNFHFGHRNEGAPLGTGLFGIQTELLYSRQGFTSKGETVNIDYFTLPILGKLYLTKEINVEAGPYIGYLLNVSPHEIMISGAQINLSTLKGELDAGLSIGAGYEMLSGLFIGARYNWGLTEMSANLPWRNSLTTISVGWMF